VVTATEAVHSGDSFACYHGWGNTLVLFLTFDESSGGAILKWLQDSSESAWRATEEEGWRKQKTEEICSTNSLNIILFTDLFFGGIKPPGLGLKRVTVSALGPMNPWHGFGFSAFSGLVLATPTCWSPGFSFINISVFGSMAAQFSPPSSSIFFSAI